MGKYTPKIAKKDLTHGSYYVGKCQYGTYARWNEIKGAFRMWRKSLGKKYLVYIKHPEDEFKFDVFVVEEECAQQEYIPLGNIIENRFLQGKLLWTSIKQKFLWKSSSMEHTMKEDVETPMSQDGMQTPNDSSTGEPSLDTPSKKKSVIQNKTKNMTFSSLKERYHRLRRKSL